VELVDCASVELELLKLDWLVLEELKLKFSDAIGPGATPTPPLSRR